MQDRFLLFQVGILFLLQEKSFVRSMIREWGGSHRGDSLQLSLYEVGEGLRELPKEAPELLVF